jgi:hypothetical protein
MTETEWPTSADPQAMLSFLRGKASDRKLRLFACACCRRIWHLLTHPASVADVEISERYADGLIDAEELKRRQWANEVESSFNGLTDDPPWHAPAVPAWLVRADRVAQGVAREAIDPVKTARGAAEAAAWEAAASHIAGQDYSAWKARVEAVRAGECAFQSEILRDLVGNPFRPASRDRSWRTPKVFALARHAYDRRAFDCLPRLADALEEAGCTEEEVLSHCRGPGQFHVKGCWAVDLVLGKS